MERRQVLIGLAAATWLSTVFAQRGRPPRIGLLDAGERVAWWTAFRKQMHELGYVEGKNIAFESRVARGKFSELPALAQELVQLPVDIIVTAGMEAAFAASRATDRVPIVTATGGDHVSRGLASSLAQPGGNVTGMTSIASELAGKRLGLLLEMQPALSRLAVLWQSSNAGSMAQYRELDVAAKTAKIALQTLAIRKGPEVADAFASAVQRAADAVYVIFGPMIYAERHEIAAMALKHRLPTMHGTAEMVDAGGLVSYGTSYPDLFRGAAFYVDKILKGAKPAELAVEQPSKFEFVINLRTARALGFTIPQAVLLRASKVID